MKTTMLIVMTVILLGAAAFAKIFFSDNEKSVSAESSAVAETHTWSEASKKALNEMTKLYGEPSEKTSSMAVWYNNGPWKRTIVYAMEHKHNFPMPHADVIEQTINYQVPAGKFSDLAMYDGSVVCNRTNGEISARCDKESMNFLALNLADDIIKGKMDVKQARESYAKTAMAFMKGDRQETTKKLQFTVMGNTNDPDMESPLIDKEEMQKMKSDAEDSQGLDK